MMERSRGWSVAAALMFFLGSPSRPAQSRPRDSTATTSRSPQLSRLAGDLDAKGLARRLARERGRVVLLNFWATWCEPCRQEYPDLVRLQRALGSRGLQILGVSTDFGSVMPAVEKFLAEQNPNFPNYHKKSGGDDQDFIEAVDKKWGGELPFSVLYDRGGRKIKTLSGKHSYKEYQQEVLGLLR